MQDYSKKESKKHLIDYVEEITAKSGGKNQYVCPFCNSGNGKNGTGAFTVYPETNSYVRLTLNDKTEIDIEIQVWYMKQWATRSVFYVSKMISEQPDINKKYSNMKKCINISILNFTYIKQTDRFYTSYHIREDKEHFKYTDIAEWHVVELPKLPEVPDGTAIYDWAKFINSEDRGEFEMLAKKNEYIAEAYKQLDIISQDQQKRLEYTARQKALYDYNELVYENYTDGYEKGVYEEKVRTAEKMLKRGVMTIDEISEDTGLSAAEIENIKTSMS